MRLRMNNELKQVKIIKKRYFIKSPIFRNLLFFMLPMLPLDNHLTINILQTFVKLLL